MSVNSEFLKTLVAYLDHQCKVVYRDGGANGRTKAFYGKLIDFDPKFETWVGKNDPRETELFQVNFYHDDISRHVMSLGAG